MPLQAPNLDSRTFDELLREARSRIATYTPEWTDFNPSDPGMALVDLFAWFTELMLYQMNRVPERNYIKFLQLLNLELKTAQPAKADLVLQVNPNARPTPVSRGTQFGGQDAETGDFLIFESETGLDLTPYNLTVVQTFNGISFEDHTAANADPSGTYQPLGEKPEADSAWYLGFGPEGGFEAPQPDNPTITDFGPSISLKVFFPTNRSAPAPAVGRPKCPSKLFAQDRVACFENTKKLLQELLEDAIRSTPEQPHCREKIEKVLADLETLHQQPNPPENHGPKLRWEYRSNEQGDRWQRLDVIEDTTRNLQETDEGYIRLHGPRKIQATNEGIIPNHYFWIRCVLATGDYPRGSTPDVAFIRPNTVSVTNLTTIREEVLGVSNGLPNQSMTLRRTPIQPNSLELVVEEALDPIGNASNQPEASEESAPKMWSQVENLRSQDEKARVYTLNVNRSEVTFGDSRHGLIPPPDAQIIAQQYRYGGGSAGNLPENTITVPLKNIEGVESVTNPRPAIGGSDEETVEELKASAPGKLKARSRAVTAEDFAAIAAEVADVKRAKAIPLAHPDHPGVPIPGCIQVVVVPDSAEPNSVDPDSIETALMPGELLLQRVRDHLNEVRLITTEIHVSAPRYSRIDLHINVTVDRSASFGEVVKNIKLRIKEHLSPTKRDFGLDLTPSELYGVVHSVDDVKNISFMGLEVDGFPHTDLTQRIEIPPDTLFSVGEIEIHPRNLRRVLINMIPVSKPTCYTLESQMGWRASSAPGDNGLVTDSDGYLTLPAAPDGPLGIPSETVGDLALPKQLATNGRGRMFLLTETHIAQWSLEQTRFTSLIAVRPNPLVDPSDRTLRDPKAIAATQSELIVVDGQTQGARLLIFDIETLVLIDILERSDWDASCLDPVAIKHDLFLLDHSGDNRRVYHWRGRGLSKLIEWRQPELESTPPNWQRLAVDSDGGIYVASKAPNRIDRIEPDPATLHPIIRGSFTDASEIRNRFEKPAARIEQPIPKEPRPQTPEPSWIHIVDPRYFASANQGAEKAVTTFTLEGNPKKPSSDASPAKGSFAQRGRWLTDALDSGIHDCTWHRIELEAAVLPPGTEITIETFTAPRSEYGRSGRGIPEPLWQANPIRFESAAGSEGKAQSAEFLIQNPPGQILFLRIRLSGDGYQRPRLKRIRVHFPRDSYLKHLPAVFSQNPDGRAFLERFLSIFQSEWDSLEKRIAHMSDLFDPDATPAELLPFVASWLKVPLEGDWAPHQNRQILKAAIRALGRRGTVQAIREHAAAYLGNMTGRTTEQMGEFPILIEGFRLRQAAQPDGPLECQPSKYPYGYTPKSRFQLLKTNCGKKRAKDGTDSNETVSGNEHHQESHGENESDCDNKQQKTSSSTKETDHDNRHHMVSIGSPKTDYFRAHANRFQVAVPAVWIQSPSDENRLRRAIAAESPAHVCHDLIAIERQCVVEVQSCVGIDSAIGARNPFQLAGSEQEEHDEAPVVNALGVNTWLPEEEPNPSTNFFEIGSTIGPSLFNPSPKSTG